MDSAPRALKPDDPVVQVLLFLPGAVHAADKEGRPTEVSHSRVVGWWDVTRSVWVAGLHPDRPAHVVYPSLWSEIPDEPQL